MTLVLCVAFALTIGVATANAKTYPSNLCTNNGWKYLTKPDGSPFGSETACVYYARNGGTLVKGPTWSTCESYGGLFLTNPKLAVIGPAYKGQRILWLCNGYNNDSANTASAALIQRCLFSDGGLAYADFGPSNNPDFGTCYQDPFPN